MFKRIKESEAYKKYKELRSNSRTSAIMSLGIWLVFFIVIIIFVRGINSGNSSRQINNVNSRLNNYEYTYINNQMTVFGQIYDGKQIFTISNNKYYYNGENVYLVNGKMLELMPNFDLNILKITAKMIDDLTINLDFTQNGEVRQYLVPLVNFINLYEFDVRVDLSEASNYNIIVQKYYDEDDLYKIEVDLSNYYKFNNLNNSGKLIINLYNKNKLNDFTLEYDKMLGVR